MSRWIRGTVACIVAFLAAACAAPSAILAPGSTETSPAGVPMAPTTPQTSAPPTATPWPAPAGTTISAITVIIPTRTPPPPGVDLPTSTPEPDWPQATPTSPIDLYPRDTRTGIVDVDRVIAALLAGDRAALGDLIRYTVTPCTRREGLGGPPKCAPGEVEGTPVEVFPVGGVEGTYERRATIDRLLDLPVTGLYAVYRLPPNASREAYWPAGDYGIVFLRPDGSLLIALAGRGGIVRLDFPVGWSPSEIQRILGGEPVLAPLAE